MKAFIVKSALVVSVALGLFASGQAFAADCPAGVDPVYCQVAAATGGQVLSGSPDEVAAQLNAVTADRMDPVVLSPETPLEALFHLRLSYLAPFLAALFPLILTFILMRKSPRSWRFHWLYGAACASGPLGLMLVLFAWDVDSNGLSSRVDLRDALLIAAGVIGFVCLPLVMLWAALSLFCQQNKVVLWGGAASSALATLWLTYYVLWNGVH